tara:strand:+ start:2300 stop:3130 length:831 start_codon:yes stop_codon:yes gene_type:complete
MIKENNIKFLFLTLSLFVIILVFFFPFFWIITSSFKSPQEIIATSTTIIPRSFTLEHYNKILFNSDFFIYLKNSLIVSFSSMVISIILSVSAAYGLHKLKFYGNKFVEYSLLVTYAFPGVILLIPIYLLFAKINLLNSYFALIIVNVLFATPFAVWMLKAFFKLIPTEIEEAAYIDGASRFVVIYMIVIPLAAPGIASIAIFCFIISWTEYLFASILISTDNLKTLPVGLASIVGQYQIDWGFLLSGAVLASLPVIFLFLFIGKYFVSGLTEGAIK